MAEDKSQYIKGKLDPNRYALVKNGTKVEIYVLGPKTQAVLKDQEGNIISVGNSLIGADIWQQVETVILGANAGELIPYEKFPKPDSSPPPPPSSDPSTTNQSNPTQTDLPTSATYGTATGAEMKFTNKWKLRIYKLGGKKYAVVFNDKDEIVKAYQQDPKDYILTDKEFANQIFNKLNEGKTSAPKEIKLTYGTLYIPSNTRVPLLITIGGKSSCGGDSGTYMKKYFKDYKDKDIFSNYIIFITNTYFNNNSEVITTYKEIINNLKKLNITPTSKVLYGFSAGWRGVKSFFQALDENKNPLTTPSEWAKIILVDLYLASDFNFFKDLAGKQNVYFIYNTGLSITDEQKLIIIGAASHPIKSTSPASNGLSSHCNSNQTAVKYL